MSTTGSDRGPLTGVRIVDFSENMAGPFGTMILADQGADVIKVESPLGDALRNRGTGARAMASYFANLNRSKRSVSIDLRNPESAEALRRLLDSADVVVHSYRPAAARRLGVDAESVRTNRPSVIHASIIGFGRQGPYAGRPVYDHVMQAMSGMAAQQKQNEADPPRLIRHGVVDKSTGHVLAQSVTAALFQRTRTHQGVAIDVVMLDVALALLWPDGMMNYTAIEPEVEGAPAASTFQLTPTLDGYVALVTLKDQSWRNLSTALNLKARLDQGARAGDVLREAREVLKTMTVAEAADLLGRHDVPCAPVVAMDDVHLQPQVIANRSLVEYDHPVIGRLRQPRPVPVFPNVIAEELSGAPVLGADTVGVLEELGFARAAIDSMLDAGIVHAPASDDAASGLEPA